MNALGIRVDRRYRTVVEARIIELLLLFGWVYEIRAGERERAAHEAVAALNHWIDLGLPFEQREGDERRFDPAEVVNFVKWAGMRLGDRLWDERFVATGRRLVQEHHRTAPTLASPPPPPAALGPRRFCVTLRREFNLRERAPGAKVRLRLPLPLEDEHLRSLTIVPGPQPLTDVDIAVTPGRLDVRLSVPRNRTVTFAVHVSFTAYPMLPGLSRASLAPAEVELYTRPNEGIATISPRVRALAAELAGTRRERRQVVERFWNFLLDRLTCGVIHYDELDLRYPTDSVLDSGWYDCQLGSALLVALCRARGIAARIVSGYLLHPTVPSYHYWAEVWMDGRGWVPLDSICADLSAMGRDKPWRDYFLGQLDYRMKTQCLPRLFTGNPAIRFPKAWHVLARPEGAGAEIGYFANDSGALLYRDQIAVHPGTGPPIWSDWPRGPVSMMNAGPL